MAHYNLQDNYNKVSKLLESKRIGKAISVLKEMLEISGLKHMKPRLGEIEDTYKYMTRYLLDGVQDSGRNEMLGRMIEQLQSISDQTIRTWKSLDSSEYYYSLLRFNALRKEKIPQIFEDYGKISSELSLAEAVGDEAHDLRKSKEQELTRLFDTLFTSLGEDNDYAELGRYMSSGYADNALISQSLSAVTLSLLFFYDSGKFNMLLDVYENCEDPVVKARALAGIIIAMIPNSKRINNDRKIMARLSLWQDSILAYSHILETIRAIVGTRDTERVTTKIKDEVIPELMKLRPDMMRSLGENPGDMESALENNPEWEEILSKSGLEKKMQELSEMQSDGADVMMLTFSNLKNFPFFNKISNWFLPFDARHTELVLDDDMKKLLTMMSESGAIVCDSDMYSMALAAKQMPAAQLNMISGQISANYQQLKEQMRKDVQESSSPEFNREVLRVVRDLYRFFKLFRKKQGFFDPFASPLQFLSLPVIGDMMSETEVVQLFGEFYFKRGYYNDALPLFLLLLHDDPDNVTLLEKIGFCHQSMGNYLNAKEYYDKSALLRTPGIWLIKRLAYVNRRLGNFAEAAEYYSLSLETDPENVSLIMHTGNMLLESGDIQGALRNFYHANYLRPDNPKVMRSVAWVELLNGNFNKAADYNDRILKSDDVKAADYLNAGHAALMSGKKKEALNLYRLASETNPEDFEKAYSADIPILHKLGADLTTLQLMLDLTLSENL